MEPQLSVINPVIKPMRGRKTGTAPAIRKLKTRFPELTNTQIAKRVGCDPANVQRVLERFLGPVNTEQDLREFQGAQADVWDSLSMRALMSVTDEDIRKAPLLARATAAGIATDKARLIRGQATSVNVNVLLDAVEAVKAMRQGRE